MISDAPKQPLLDTLHMQVSGNKVFYLQLFSRIHGVEVLVEPPTHT